MDDDISIDYLHILCIEVIKRTEFSEISMWVGISWFQSYSQTPRELETPNCKEPMAIWRGSQFPNPKSESTQLQTKVNKMKGMTIG